MSLLDMITNELGGDREVAKNVISMVLDEVCHPASEAMREALFANPGGENGDEIAEADWQTLVQQRRREIETNT